MSAILNKPAEQMLSEHQHEHWNELHTSGLAAGEGSGLRGQSLPGALRDSQAAPPGPDLADAVKPPRHLSTTGRGQAGKRRGGNPENSENMELPRAVPSPLC